MKFKEGNIVSYIYFEVDIKRKVIRQNIRTGILFNISKKDIKEGFKSNKTGLHLIYPHFILYKKKTLAEYKNCSTVYGHISEFTGKDSKYPLTLLHEDCSKIKLSTLKKMW